MIVLLFGEDRFARTEALHELREPYDADGSLTANSLTLEGQALSPAALRAAVLTVPFLADHRLVRVEGLAGRFNYGQRRGQRRGVGEWDGLDEILAEVPPTTILVFMEEALDARNPIRRVIEEHAEAREFKRLRQRDAAPWLRQRARAAGVHLTPAAERLLAERVSGDRGAIAGAVEKLHLYAGDAAIDEQVVELLVPAVREATIFQLVDAVAEQRLSGAMRALDVLRAGGLEERRVIAMLARQFRMIIVAREILDGGGSLGDVEESLGVRGFVARRAADQAQRYTQAEADAALGRILSAEEAIQDYWQGRERGVAQDVAIELLVADLASGRAPARV